MRQSSVNPTERDLAQLMTGVEVEQVAEALSDGVEIAGDFRAITPGVESEWPLQIEPIAFMGS